MIEILDSAAGPAFTASDVLLDLVDEAADRALGSAGPPILFVVSGEERTFTRFVGGDAGEGVREAQRVLAELDAAEAWVVAAVGLVNGQQALIIHAGEERSDTTLVFYQRYRSGADGAIPDGPIRFLTEEPPLRPHTTGYGCIDGYGAFVLLPQDSDASLSAAIEPVRKALDKADGGAKFTRERTRLVVDCAEGEWRLTVGLWAGPLVEGLAPKLLEHAAETENFGPGHGMFKPGHAMFKVETSPDEDMEFFNDWLFVIDALETAFGARSIDRASSG